MNDLIRQFDFKPNSCGSCPRCLYGKHAPESELYDLIIIVKIDQPKYIFTYIYVKIDQPMLYPSYIRTFDFIVSVQPYIYCYIIYYTLLGLWIFENILFSILGSVLIFLYFILYFIFILEACKIRKGKKNFYSVVYLFFHLSKRTSAYDIILWIVS